MTQPSMPASGAKLTSQILVLVSLLAGSAAVAGEAVSIPTSDGFPLAARLYSGAEDQPAILLLHQCDRQGAATGFEELAERLQARGFHVLIPDYRTYGGSVNEDYPAGEWRLSSPHMDGDAEAAFDYLVSRPGVKAEAAGVAGASCGGRLAIHLATRHDEIKTLVFLSTMINRVTKPKYEALSHLPVFAAVAKKDPFGITTQSMKGVVADSEHPESHLQMYEGTDHGTPLFERDPALLDQVVAWFDKHLRGAPEQPAD